ncbi:MAG: cob(I)yrinic acid a,c-diamide adenosyltransferase [Planctomycetes bacterium]|nr:cob(I)yrinic acid a,c-diamide adenosyltransferase [Planctomycetota bacterium]
MRIYTRTGDEGKTGLIGGARRSKADPRIAAYGDVDELNASLGVAATSMKDASDLARLRIVQEELFQIGTHLASPDPAKAGVPLPGPETVKRMESWIDEAWDRAGPLRRFILPGGCAAGAALHLARTICRRAERGVVALSSRETVDPGIVLYLNRLSDWLFAWARDVNARAGTPEPEWKP